MDGNISFLEIYLGKERNLESSFYEVQQGIMFHGGFFFLY